MMKFSVGLACAALVLAGCASNGGKQLAQATQPAPDWTQPTSTGGTLTLSSLRGKAVYLNFFATWCPPCRDEAPYINSLQKQYGSRGLQVVGIDELENAKLAESFRQRFNLVYPAVVDSGTLQAQYLINGLPVHVFIGRDGVIRKIVAGEMPKNEILRNVLSIL
jgi:cytochrome c biogenesis protein CcmG/thiol:disulfide interchange protein DsbE